MEKIPKEETSLKSREQSSDISEDIIEDEKIINFNEYKRLTCGDIAILVIYTLLLALTMFCLFSDKVDLRGLFSDNENDKRIYELEPDNKTNIEKEPEKLKCKSGFFIPKDDEDECFKCRVKHCDKCFGNKKKDICTACKKSFNPILDKDNKIIQCVKSPREGTEVVCLKFKGHNCEKCNLGYELKEGKCLLNYSIRAIYKTNEDKENILLLNKDYEDYIEELIIDKVKVKSSYNYTFVKKGKHDVIILLDNSKLVLAKNMFLNITNLISIKFSKKFNTKKIVNMKGMFKDCTQLINLDLTNINTKNVKDLSHMFDNCISLISIDVSSFDTKNVKDISYMFSNCKKLNSISLKSFNTINVIDMNGLFLGCSSLTSIDLTNFKAKKTEFMSYMFGGCFSLTSIDISSFKVKSLKDMSYMFHNCSNLKDINLNIHGGENVTNMEGLFMGCSSLDSIDLKNFETNNLKNINKMFYGCKNLKNLDISSFKAIKLDISDGLFDKEASKNGQIIIKKEFYNLAKDNIPKEWKVKYEK